METMYIFIDGYDVTAIYKTSIVLMTLGIPEQCGNGTMVVANDVKKRQLRLTVRDHNGFSKYRTYLQNGLYALDDQRAVRVGPRFEFGPAFMPVETYEPHEIDARFVTIDRGFPAFEEALTNLSDGNFSVGYDNYPRLIGAIHQGSEAFVEDERIHLRISTGETKVFCFITEPGIREPARVYGVKVKYTLEGLVFESIMTELYFREDPRTGHIMVTNRVIRGLPMFV